MLNEVVISEGKHLSWSVGVRVVTLVIPAVISPLDHLLIQRARLVQGPIQLVTYLFEFILRF